MFQVPVEEQQEVYDRKVRRALEKKKEKEDQERCLQAVMKITGWTEEYTRETLDRAMEEVGSSYEHYLIYRFWELTEEEQKTYFTKRDAVTLRRKYTQNPDVKKLMKNKDLFYEHFHKYLGRDWMKTKGMTLEEFKKKFANEEKIMYKPLDASGGYGIEVFFLKDTAIEEVYKKLISLPDGIVEQYLLQHSEMQKLSLLFGALIAHL